MRAKGGSGEGILSLTLSYVSFSLFQRLPLLLGHCSALEYPVILHQCNPYIRRLMLSSSKTINIGDTTELY